MFRPQKGCCRLAVSTAIDTTSGLSIMTLPAPCCFTMYAETFRLDATVQRVLWSSVASKDTKSADHDRLITTTDVCMLGAPTYMVQVNLPVCLWALWTHVQQPANIQWLGELEIAHMTWLQQAKSTMKPTVLLCRTALCHMCTVITSSLRMPIRSRKGI